MDESTSRFEEKEVGLPKTDTTTKMPETKDSKEVVEEVDFDPERLKKAKDGIIAEIRKAAANELGVNVNVSGRVEIVFKFGFEK